MAVGSVDGGRCRRLKDLCSRDLCNEIGLRLPKSEQLLRFPEHVLLEGLQLLVNHLFVLLFFYEQLVDLFCLRLEICETSNQSIGTATTSNTGHRLNMGNFVVRTLPAAFWLLRDD